MVRVSRNIFNKVRETRTMSMNFSNHAMHVLLFKTEVIQ